LHIFSFYSFSKTGKYFFALKKVDFSSLIKLKPAFSKTLKLSLLEHSILAKHSRG